MGRPAGYEANPYAFEDILKLRDLTVAELARRAGVPRATIASLIGRHSGAGIGTVGKLADALGCHPQTLFPALVPPRGRRAA
jgi:plasmid maintenance system antidote protein VapI